MKKFSIILSALTCLIVLGYAAFRWVCYDMMDVNTILLGSIAVSYLFNSLTWGDINGENAKDELDQHIKTQSAKIGYFVLMALSFLILFISEGTSNLNEIKNLPLAIVVCLTFIVLPITEFIYSRKYR